MEIALIFLFTIIFLIVGLISSRMVIDVGEIEAHSSNFKKIYLDKFQISIKIYLFKKIKFVTINIYKNCIKIWNLKIAFSKKYKSIIKKYIINSLRKNKTNNLIVSNMKIKDIKIEKFKFEFCFGTENPCLTSFLTMSISSVIGIFLGKIMKKYDNKRYNFKIVPNYVNTNNFYLNFNMKLDFGALNLMKIILNNTKLAKSE